MNPPIFIVQQETDREFFSAVGLTALTDYRSIIEGGQIVIIGNGDSGQSEGIAAYLSEHSKPEKLKIVHLPSPLADWLADHSIMSDLATISKATPLWKSASTVDKLAEVKAHADAVASIMPEVEEMLISGLAHIQIHEFFKKKGISLDVVADCLAAVTDAETGSVQEVPAPTESFYYERYKKEYLLRNNRGAWLCLSESQFKKELISRGIEGCKGKHDLVSEVDAKLIYLRGFHDIDYAASLAGYDEGFYEINGQRVLVTDSPRIPLPVKGEWPTLQRYLEGLFVDGEHDQIAYFMGWLKIAYTSLRSHSRRPGQALVLCGPRNCGKSLLQQLITIILGGRVAKPYAFMTEGTSFNADLFQAEHLCIDDEPATTDLRSRRAFGSQIKQITACDTQRCHPKNKQALTLSPFWRLTISLNDESENLMVLPPVDDSIADKLILLKTCTPPSGAMPMSTAGGSERAAFWNTLLKEIPAFLHTLTEWVIEPSLVSQRYGITHFHHPSILDELDALSPEYRLLNIIDAVLFSGELPIQWTGASQDLEAKLTSDERFAYDARRLLSWNTACGVYLSRLARKCPDRFTEVRSKKNRSWTIKPPACD